MEDRIARILDRALTFLAGAFATLLYLRWSQPARIPVVETLHAIVLSSIQLTMLAHLVLSWRRRKLEPVREVSAARSGALVVVATGGAAAAALGWGYRDTSELIGPAAIVAVTIAVAVAVYAFARRHAGEIGEARFDTRPWTRGDADA